ncbi:hypothetical protein [Arsukibacterium sp.]|uniref:hypothetical protein n=1 Tax=Arsukibacterium sp. TaxID=1977258 RepID=UPI00299D39A1|nr:hypothetical protein [Arsukibacterium sp.]MDX1676328.1 hypothetical protein [Arsukibacterium sp.]
MKSRRQLLLLIPAAVILTGCSVTPKYVITPDYEYMQKVEASTRYHANAAKVYWVNPPVKRVLREDIKPN